MQCLHGLLPDPARVVRKMGPRVLIARLCYRLKHEMDERSAAILSSHLTSTVVDTVDQGWEECINAAMTHLLRTSLAKNARESATVAAPLEALEGASSSFRLLVVSRQLAAALGRLIR